MSSGMYPSIIL